MQIAQHYKSVSRKGVSPCAQPKEVATPDFGGDALSPIARIYQAATDFKPRGYCCSAAPLICIMILPQRAVKVKEKYILF